MAHLLSDNEGHNGTVYVPVYTKPDFAQPVHIRMSSHAPRRVRRSRRETLFWTFACVWAGLGLLALGLGLRDIALAAFRLATGGHV